MTIRSRLLSLLLPPIIAFVALIGVFFYYNWYKEILRSARESLKAVVVSSSHCLSAQKVSWLIEHAQEPGVINSPIYRHYHKMLHEIKEQLSLSNIGLLQVLPVKKGEPILLDRGLSDTNHIFDGQNQLDAYRQVYLLDATEPLEEDVKTPSHHPGEQDFSETDERIVYQTKEAFITPIYTSRDTKERFLTGYAPIMNADGEVIALLAADMSLRVIDAKLTDALLMIGLASFFGIALVVLTLIWVANKISRPVSLLKNSALSIAAGEYGKAIQVSGPTEIVELANTFSTMSECLKETITRLRESAAARERLYGEYECSLLLQHHMFQKVVDEFRDRHVKLRALKANAPNSSQGLLLRIDRDKRQGVTFSVSESKEKGFKGLFHLLRDVSSASRSYPHLQMTIHPEYKHLSYEAHGMDPPIVWSLERKEALTFEDGQLELEGEALLFIYNSGLKQMLSSREAISQWLTRILRHFGSEGLELFVTMLHNEINFMTQYQSLTQNLAILCVHLTKTKARELTES